MLRQWVIKVLGTIIGGWLFFVGMTIETLGTNKIYDYIFIIWTILAVCSVVLLKLHSNVLD